MKQQRLEVNFMSRINDACLTLVYTCMYSYCLYRDVLLQFVEGPFNTVMYVVRASIM